MADSELKLVTQVQTARAKRRTVDMANLLVLAERAQALTEECTDCHQPIGVQCVNLKSGEPLQKQSAHLIRLKAAGLITTPRGGHDV